MVHTASEAGSSVLDSKFSFRSKLILGVCSLVLATGITVTWLAHKSALRNTEEMTELLFREVSERAVVHSQDYVLRARPVVESLVQLSQDGLAIDDTNRLLHQFAAIHKANPGLSWISFGEENGNFTGVYRSDPTHLRTNTSRIVNGKTELIEEDIKPNGAFKFFRKDNDSGYDPRSRPF